jgi:hypothetical protein
MATTTTVATKAGALKSMLNTISKGFNSAGALIDVTTDGIGMLSATVTKAATEQKKSHFLAAQTFDQDLIRSYAEEQAHANLRVKEFCRQSEDHARLYQEAHDDFAAKFAKAFPS